MKRKRFKPRVKKIRLLSLLYINKIINKNIKKRRNSQVNFLKKRQGARATRYRNLHYFLQKNKIAPSVHLIKHLYKKIKWIINSLKSLLKKMWCWAKNNWIFLFFTIFAIIMYDFFTSK